MAIRWGIIGVGDIARKRVAGAMQLDQHSELVAACRRDEQKLTQFCGEFSVPRAYTSAEDLIADEDIDVVYLATPVNEHLPHTIAAAQAGKHVLCEKPMALSADECDEMIQVCQQNNVTLGVAYYRRFYPAVLRMQELLAAGEIGTPLSVSIVCATPMDMQPAEDGYWRVVPDAGGGGALMDIGSHRINLLLAMFGEIASIRAMHSTLAADYESENVSSTLMQFSSGLHACMTCLFNTPFDPDRFEIIGTRGRMLSSPLNGGDLLIETRDGVRTESLPPHANLHYPLVADFAMAILESRPPLVTGEEGRATTGVIDRIYAAGHDS